MRFLSSEFFWKQYLGWSRIVYAPLPAKIYFFLLFWRRVAVAYYGMFEAWIRDKLIEFECELAEYAMPAMNENTHAQLQEEEDTGDTDSGVECEYDDEGDY